MLKRIKSMSQWEKDLVNGYAKNVQKLSAHNIPAAISYLCMIYYHENDHFEQHPKFDTVNVNDAKDTMTTEGGKWAEVYGKFIITNADTKIPMIYSWTFEIAGVSKSYETSIGICKGNSTLIGTHQWPELAYELSHDGDKALIKFGKFKYKTYSFERYTKGGIVKMEINMRQKTIKFYVNGKDQGIAFNDIDFSKIYNVIVGAGDKGITIKLTNFTRKICYD